MLARGDAAAVEWLEEAVNLDTELLRAGAIYAEIWRGHSQSPVAGQQPIRLAKALEAMTAVPTDEVIGCGAGQLIAVAGLPPATPGPSTRSSSSPPSPATPPCSSPMQTTLAALLTPRACSS